MSRRLGLLFRFVVAALAMFVWLPPASAAGPPRIASMNVCTDQLVVALADPEQIAGLSRFSRDGWQTSTGDAGRYPILSGGAEDVLLLKPDIVVASLFDKRSTRELLKEKGLRVAEFAVPRGFRQRPAGDRGGRAAAGRRSRGGA